MRDRISAHVRRNVVGYIALFAALGGTAQAAVGLNPGKVRSTTTTTSASLPGTPGGLPGTPDDSGSVAARPRFTSSVEGTHGGWTDVPLTDHTWTQAAGELELLAGTVVIETPDGCTGSFGNALVLLVDGKAATFAAAPAAPASSTLTVPFVIGTLSEPGRDTEHTLSARFGNSCTKDGEDYTIKDVQVDVLKFH